MANSSFLSRFSLSRDDSPVLPLHTNSRPLRHKPSEYDLEELSPRPSQSVIFSAADADPPDFFPEAESSKGGPSSVSFAYQDAYRDKTSSSRSSSRRLRDYDHDDEEVRPRSQTKLPVLFAGPPPPIATSMLMYRDIDDRSGSVLEHGRRRNNNLGASTMTTASSIRLPTQTVLLNPRQAPGGTRQRRRDGTQFDGDSTWAILQRRERALQNDIQKYLDVQSAGLSAGLGRGPLNPSPSPGPSSGAGSDRGGRRDRSQGSRGSRSNTPTADSIVGRSIRLPTDRATPAGAVIPVRQPKPRKLGLRAARTGLARCISLLADLKAEEDDTLSTALQARKRALAHLRRLSGRRSEIVRELQTLETDDAEPLTRELTTLRSSHASTTQQITELEGQLAMLRQRKRLLEGRIEDAMSQRESGLSGYRGALKEVEAQLTAVLRRPPIQPLDVDAMGVRGGENDHPKEGAIRLEERDGARGDTENEEDEDTDASAGMEFLRLLPERRTAEMARFWWENEIRLLERRKAEVDTERAALEEGGVVWQEAIQLVSDFETNLRKEMAGGSDDDADINKGKARAPTPEERMRAQLQTMAEVIKSLRRHVQTAENKGWNLLICAIGAELEAFEEARNMLRQSLRDAGFEVEDDEIDGKQENDGKAWLDGTNSNLIDTVGLNTGDTAKSTPPPGFSQDDVEDSLATPRLARSTSDASAAAAKGGHDRGYNTASESEDNEVPPGLFVNPAHDEDRNRDEETSSVNGSRHNDKDDSSENEIPPEFLSEHQPDDDSEA